MHIPSSYMFYLLASEYTAKAMCCVCVIGRHTTLHTLYELGVLYMGTFDMRDLVLHR